MYTSVLVGLLLSAAAALPSDSCAHLKEALQEDSAATAFCSSHLSILDDVYTTTSTLTKRDTLAANAKTTTATTTVTKTKTTYASIFTVSQPLTGCPSPAASTTTAQKRAASEQIPSALQKLSDSEVSEACDCLDITPATRTRTARNTVTVTDHFDLARDVAAEKTTTVTQKHKTTTTISSVTPTVTVTSGINLLSSANNQWAHVEALVSIYGDPSRFVEFNTTQQSQASVFDLNPSENTLLYGTTTALGLSYPSGEYVIFENEPFHPPPFHCSITRGESSCTLGCLSTEQPSSGNYVEYKAPHSWYIGTSGRASGAEFTVYAVGTS